jgi:hypothetical protein
MYTYMLVEHFVDHNEITLLELTGGKVHSHIYYIYAVVLFLRYLKTRNNPSAIKSGEYWILCRRARIYPSV